MAWNRLKVSWGANITARYSMDTKLQAEETTQVTNKLKFTLWSGVFTPAVSVEFVFQHFKAQGSLYVPPCLTFNTYTFSPHSVFMCFVWIWEQTAIISLYSINWLVCVTETGCVYCAVRTGYLYTILRSAHTVYLCVLCGSENRQRLFPYTALTGWFV